MALIDTADWQRRSEFAEAPLYASFGAGPFRLAPSACAVMADADGEIPFSLELIRALKPGDARALLSATIEAVYPLDEALLAAREINRAATIAPLVPSAWRFRFLPSPALETGNGLLEPVSLIATGLGSARLQMALSLDAGLFLEDMLKSGGSLPALAEAEIAGVSPRVPAVATFSAEELLEDLHGIADSQGALPRAAVLSYFGRDESQLPLRVDWSGEVHSLVDFAETMTDRVIAAYASPIDAADMNDAPVVQLRPVGSASSQVRWSLASAFVAQRRMIFPVDLLSMAQHHIANHGPESLIRRRDVSTLPGLGNARINVLFNLPQRRAGLAALGVTISFPPFPPKRPQARTVTVLLDDDSSDIREIMVTLSPGEPLRYEYTPFAVIETDGNTVQIDGAPRAGEGATLRLTPDLFPVDLVRIEATPALISLGTLRGACSYTDAQGLQRQVPFALSSGNLGLAVAVPHGSTGLAITGTATPRSGSPTIPLPVVEDLAALYDVTSFETYGPQEIPIRLQFDDGAHFRALSLLPSGVPDFSDLTQVLSFTPAEPERLFAWSSPSPFAPELRYRSFDRENSPWQIALANAPLMVRSSSLSTSERALALLERGAGSLRESGKEKSPEPSLEGLEVTPEAAIVPVARASEEVVGETSILTAITDSSQRFYVPQYALGIDPLTSGQRYQIAFLQEGQNLVLRIGFEVSPHPWVTANAPDATECPHQASVALDYLIAPPAGARRSLEFGELVREGNRLWARFTFASMLERDDTYRALTEAARDARLIVRRQFDLAVPQPIVPAPLGPAPLDPNWFANVLPVRPYSVWPPSDPDPLTILPVKAQVDSINLATLAVAAQPAVTLQPAVMAQPVSTALMSRKSLALGSLRESEPVKASLKARMLPADSLILVRDKRRPSRLPEPKLELRSIETQDGGETAITLAVANWEDFSEDFFTTAPDLPPGSMGAKPWRTWIDVEDGESGARIYNFCEIFSPKQLQALTFRLGRDQDVPPTMRLHMIDRVGGGESISEPIKRGKIKAAEPSYADRRIALEQSCGPAPFLFPPALHPYLIDGQAPQGGAMPLIRHTLAWQGRFHTYLQDPTRRSTVYSFPDSFKIARREEAPFTPFATVRVFTEEASQQQTVIFDYLVAPHSDSARLANARQQLLALPQFGALAVDFKPLPTSDVRFFIDRPTALGSRQEERPDAAIVLQGALKDTLSMSLEDFSPLFDAMHAATAALFIGRVEIGVPGGAPVVVPFEARFDDLEGQVFDWHVATDGTNLALTLANAIESPIDVSALEITVMQGETPVVGTLAPGGLPRSGLPPGGVINLQFQPAQALPASAAPALLIGTGAVSVNVDPEAVWNAILDRRTVNCYRKIRVRAVAGNFTPPSGRETEQIVAILFEFVGGSTVELSASQLEAQVRVDYPIDSVVLGQTVSETCSYVQRVIRANGDQQVDAMPRSSSATIIYAQVTV